MTATTHHGSRPVRDGVHAGFRVGSSGPQPGPDVSGVQGSRVHGSLDPDPWTPPPDAGEKGAEAGGVASTRSKTSALGSRAPRYAPRVVSWGLDVEEKPGAHAFAPTSTNTTRGVAKRSRPAASRAAGARACPAPTFEPERSPTSLEAELAHLASTSLDLGAGSRICSPLSRALGESWAIHRSLGRRDNRAIAKACAEGGRR